MAEEIPETAAHSNWSLESAIGNPQSAIERWLRSFPTAWLRPKHSDDDLQGMPQRDRFWPCRANWGAAKLYLRKVSWPAGEATPPFLALTLRLCTNTEMGDCLSIILISFAWRIASPSRGLASTTIFLATESPSSNGQIAFRTSILENS